MVDRLSIESRGRRYMTICVEQVRSVETSRRLWGCDRSHPLPVRVVCYWREADIFLAGAFCQQPSDVINILQSAMRIADEIRIARMLFGGAECWLPDVLKWLKEQRFPYRTGLSAPVCRTKEKQLGYILSTPPSASAIEAIKEPALKWAAVERRDSTPTEWVRLAPNPDFADVKLTALRQRRVAANEYEYSLLGSNRDSSGTDLLIRFEKGRMDVAHAINDLQQLAHGSYPPYVAGDDEEGRFRLALLTYNICSGIRYLVKDQAPIKIPIGRFRELFIHGAGRLASGQRNTLLKFNDKRISRVFLQTLEALFPAM